MHSLYFVKKAKEKNETSLSVRNEVFAVLENEGFCSTGFFSLNKSDWFVIGGRWSGILKRLTEKQEPETRDHYQYNGYEDDAMILTHDLYKALTEGEYKREVDCYDMDEYNESYIEQILKPKDIGKVWIVTIDYHY